MRDRVPTPGRENRVKITQDDGTVVAGVLEYDDQATQEGSPYTKGNVLPDDVCGLLGIDPIESEPKDAWLGVISSMGYCIVTLTVLQVDGSPLSGFKVEGLTGVIDEKCYTDQNGKIFLIMQEGEYSLSIPTADCVDSHFAAQSVNIASGNPTNITMQAVSKGTSAVYTSSQSGLQFSGAVAQVDVFCCGGGGGGGGGRSGASDTISGGGGGGGGGYTETVEDVNFNPFEKFNVSVGSGGRGGEGGATTYVENGSTGGASSALGVSALGGRYGYCYSTDVGGDNRSAGGDGGSGGGGGKFVGRTGPDGGDGGSNGSNGGTGQGLADGGTGQGTSTMSLLGTLCSGGGAGGSSNMGTAGRGSPGRGGNGGAAVIGSQTNAVNGKNGSAGRVELRWVFKS